MKKLEDFGVPYPSRHISAVNSCTKGACRGLNQENLALFVQRNQRKKTGAPKMEVWFLMKIFQKMEFWCDFAKILFGREWFSGSTKVWFSKFMERMIFPTIPSWHQCWRNADVDQMGRLSVKSPLIGKISVDIAYWIPVHVGEHLRVGQVQSL